MFISYLQTNPQYYFAVILVVIISICLHELAHGFTAIALGDRTPEETGHITLNPLEHMGTMSLIMLAVVGISWGAMPVDPTRMRGRYADAIVSVAGPLTNLALAAIGLLSISLWAHFGTIDTSNHMVRNALMLLYVLSVFNMVLFALNLIPVPPLDGSRILADFVPAYRRLTSDPTMQGVFFAVMMAVFFGAGRVLFPAAEQILINVLPREALIAIAKMLQASGRG
jgi:Zn-dependent protease